MKDLRPDITGLWRALRRVPSREGGQIVLVCGARAGEGTSSVAASLAVLAQARARRAVWLVDLDLSANHAFRAFEQGFAPELGQPGRAYDAGFSTAPVRVAGKPAAPGQRSLFCAHQIGLSKLFVTRLRRELLKSGETVRFMPSAGWWQALRAQAEFIIIDAPPLEVSGAALAVAKQVDASLIVVRSDRTCAQDVMAVREELESYGGQVVGLVLNGVRGDARLAERMGA